MVNPINYSEEVIIVVPEIETYNEIEYNELVIKMGGDVDGAKDTFARELERRKADFDIISTIIRWYVDKG